MERLSWIVWGGSNLIIIVLINFESENLTDGIMRGTPPNIADFEDRKVSLGQVSGQILEARNNNETISPRAFKREQSVKPWF